MDKPREVYNFNMEWKFLREDLSGAEVERFDDSTWEQVSLPHSVRLEPANASYMYNYQGVCWYRKNFLLDSSLKDKKIFIKFEGAMNVAEVWVNGAKLSEHYGGYLPFTVDITDYARFDNESNIIAVRLDNSNNPDIPPGKPQDDLDFCYFGGLYRDVNVVVTNNLHITDSVHADKVAGGGIFVTYPEVSSELASVQIKTHIINEYSTLKNCRVVTTILDAEGNTVCKAESTAEISNGKDYTFTELVKVENPKLWHPYHPYLYKVQTAVYNEWELVDEYTTRLGIRTIKFDKDTGFWINGEKLQAMGANRHQEYVHVGNALPKSGQYRDVKKLREAGFVSLRLSHYPQHPSFMEACDELGLMCIVPTPGWQFFGGSLFCERSYQDVREMVRRDRNHPCVIMWEPILNETNYSEEYARTVYNIVHEEYPGDQCYAGADSHLYGDKYFDVVFHERKGEKPSWIRECGEVVDNWTDQCFPNRVQRKWGEAVMLIQAKHYLNTLNNLYKDERLSGFGLWVGIDHNRGYHQNPSWAGVMDVYRIPKFAYYLYRSQLPPEVSVDGLDDGPMIFIANYWSQFSSEDVTVYSNCDMVRLVQDGKVIGVQKPDEGNFLPHPPFTFKGLRWNPGRHDENKSWVAGELKAEGLIDGKVVATHVVRMPGVATQLTLLVDYCGKELTADGSDFVMVYVSVRDERGTVVSLADNLIKFTLEGEGRIIGNESIGSNPVRAEAGVIGVLVSSTQKSGKIKLKASSYGLKSAEVTIESIPLKDKCL